MQEAVRLVGRRRQRVREIHGVGEEVCVRLECDGAREGSGRSLHFCRSRERITKVSDYAIIVVHPFYFVSDCRTAGEICTILVQKCIANARKKVADRAQEILLMYIEVEKPDIVMVSSFVLSWTDANFIHIMIHVEMAVICIE